MSTRRMYCRRRVSGEQSEGLQVAAMSRDKRIKAAGAGPSAASEILLGYFHPSLGDGSKSAGFRYTSSTGNERRAKTARDTLPLWGQGHKAKKQKKGATRATEKEEGANPRGWSIQEAKKQ